MLLAYRQVNSAASPRLVRMPKVETPVAALALLRNTRRVIPVMANSPPLLPPLAKIQPGRGTRNTALLIANEPVEMNPSPPAPVKLKVTGSTDDGVGYAMLIRDGHSYHVLRDR